mmetsp:Transcript_4053/g.10331  ORF Transcript_4053/g.10331 Transcript_4053/m.10331 type:complete len:947 (-) Transcript_4053:1904-4744(-)
MDMSQDNFVYQKDNLTGRVYRYSASTSYPRASSSPPETVDYRGRSLLAPNSALARAVFMGNERSRTNTMPHGSKSPDVPRDQASNLTVLMAEHEQQRNKNEGSSPLHADEGNLVIGTDSEADSACGLPKFRPALGSSAPSAVKVSSLRTQDITTTQAFQLHPSAASRPRSNTGVRFRRCFSSKELGTLAPPSGSRYGEMMERKSEIEEATKQRLQEIKASLRDVAIEQSDDSTSASSHPREGGNQSRNRRRNEHNQAIVNDLCQVVADLFISESKLLQAASYGVADDPLDPSRKDNVVASVHNFVSALPSRYALGIDTPSEVLLHMRLMAAARSDRTKAAVHIHSLDEDGEQGNSAGRIMLVTISCRDTQGLLELITRSLASGGSRVRDADAMTSTDGVVLDRFTVAMRGRLRLDKLTEVIEGLLQVTIEGEGVTHSSKEPAGEKTNRQPPATSGPLYVNEETSVTMKQRTPQDIYREVETAVPLADMLRSPDMPGLELPRLRKMQSMPEARPSFKLSMRPEPLGDGVLEQQNQSTDDADQKTRSDPQSPLVKSDRQRRPLVNRRATPDLGVFESASKLELQPLDYVTVPNATNNGSDSRVALIPFDELMLIETIGTGRVSTIYRAAWQSAHFTEPSAMSVQMVALKVAMVNSQSGGTGHVDELRREADIAARLDHPNICDLVGVAADTECFCLAYEFCEGGSLLSLLSDSRRFYEYLPIALDIACAMAYLHSRSIIHRDLKPSNILLTADHRAKIADFGMSVAPDPGQELTAETGTYRYMAPEVIRHESYSSNADVYSFGVCLWQLITREIPFGTMTPIQAAFAVAEGGRPPIPPSTPRRLQEIIEACWDQDSHRRPSFTYIAMSLADYAKMAFSPANVGTSTLQIANEIIRQVDGNSTVNVDMTAPVITRPSPTMSPRQGYIDNYLGRSDSMNSDVGLAIENWW